MNGRIENRSWGSTVSFGAARSPVRSRKLVIKTANNWLESTINSRGRRRVYVNPSMMDPRKTSVMIIDVTRPLTDLSRRFQMPR